jgi:PTS system maltose and glucose-specific IIC component
MAIYSGHCFVAIVMLPVSMLLGVVMSELWPFAQHGISALALAIKGSGPFGVAIYGFLERILVPTGLHHLVYTPFLYTELGGTQEVCGATYQGARNIYFRRDGLPGREAAQQHRGVGRARHQQNVRPACRGAGDVYDRKAGA